MPKSGPKSIRIQAQRSLAPARREDSFLVPPANIFEDDDGITVEAELPGVSKQHLNIQGDRNNLVIEGEAVIDLPAGMEALYADLQSTKYRRSFCGYRSAPSSSPGRSRSGPAEAPGADTPGSMVIRRPAGRATLRPVLEKRRASEATATAPAR
jgi:hypothetical protein